MGFERSFDRMVLASSTQPRQCVVVVVENTSEMLV